MWKRNAAASEIFRQHMGRKSRLLWIQVDGNDVEVNRGQDCVAIAEMSKSRNCLSPPTDTPSPYRHPQSCGSPQWLVPRDGRGGFPPVHLFGLCGLGAQGLERVLCWSAAWPGILAQEGREWDSRMLIEAGAELRDSLRTIPNFDAGGNHVPSLSPGGVHRLRVFLSPDVTRPVIGQHNSCELL